MEAVSKKSRIVEISMPSSIDEKWVRDVIENALVEKLVKESKLDKLQKLINSLGLKPSEVSKFEKMRKELWAQKKKSYGL